MYWVISEIPERKDRGVHSLSFQWISCFCCFSAHIPILPIVGIHRYLIAAYIHPFFLQQVFLLFLWNGRDDWSGTQLEGNPRQPILLILPWSCRRQLLSLLGAEECCKFCCLAKRARTGAVHVGSWSGWTPRPTELCCPLQLAVQSLQFFVTWFLWWDAGTKQRTYDQVEVMIALVVIVW